MHCKYQRVLFISSGNNKYGVSPIIKSQGEALRSQKIQVDFFTIKGKGAIGYLSNLVRLKKIMRTVHYDLLHAHYSLSAYLSTLCFPKVPLVVSLMGSDSKVGFLGKAIIKLFASLFWAVTIVKSAEMKNSLALKNAFIVPNGVNLEIFKLYEKNTAQKNVGFSASRINVIFLANPIRYEKNYDLALKSITLVKTDINILPIFYKKQEEVVQYLNAADILLLTSRWEGSPNAIKEAMACNLPVVATNVGDIEWLFGNTEGHYLANQKAEDIAEKLELAIEFVRYKGRTIGRNRIINLALDSESVAISIISIYNCIENK